MLMIILNKLTEASLKKERYPYDHAVVENKNDIMYDLLALLVVISLISGDDDD